MINPEKIQYYFKQINSATQKSGQYFSDRKAVIRALDIIYDFLKDNALICPGNHVLDVGMGGGQTCRTLTNRFGARCWGISLNQKEIVNAKMLKISAQIADFHNLPFENRFFNSLWASHVLEHSIAPLIALQEWKRVIKDNGRIFLWGPIGRDFKGENDGTCVYGCRDHLLTPTKWQYRWLFELSGLKVEHELDAPYQIINSRQQKIYNLKKSSLRFLKFFRLTLLPKYSLNTAVFFVLKKYE